MDEIRFIDLFSGIGGFRLGLEKSNQSLTQGKISTGSNIQHEGNSSNSTCGEPSKYSPLYEDNGFRCVWSCDNNKYANQVYTSRFGEENHHSGDIRKVRASSIPDHDLLCAGFPCQAFSVAGKRHGFSDTRGTLFFEIARIARAKRPTLLLLENVKGLLSHDEGLTYQIILESLEELGYLVEWQVLNSKHYGVPQNRERVFIIGHLRGRSTRPIFPITKISGGLSTTNGQRSQTNIAPTIDRRVGASTHFSPYVVVDPFNKAERQDMMAGAVKTNQGSPTSTGTAIVEPFIKNIPHGYNDGFEKELPSLKSNKGAQYNELLVQPVLRWQNKKDGIVSDDIIPTLRASGGTDIRKKPVVIQIKRHRKDGDHLIRTYENETPTLTQQMGTGGGNVPLVSNSGDTSGYLRQMGRHEEGKHGLTDYRIRRLTPVECERLQGFPDGWTEGISDTQRYKCLGNAVTVNVIKFLGDRIKESINSKSKRMET